MTNSSIVLVQEKNGVYKLKVEVPMLSRPYYFITFTFWNQTQRSIDGIVIVSIKNELVFLRVNEAMDKMEIIWMWPVNQMAKYLHHFIIDNSDTLLIITDLHNGSAASLYRFDMNEEVFFLRQTLTLKTRSMNMALIQSGHETFMCFPQKSHAVIYKHEHQHFKYYTKIESHNARILSGFQMGIYFLFHFIHTLFLLNFHCFYFSFLLLLRWLFIFDDWREKGKNITLSSWAIYRSNHFNEIVGRC